MVVFDATMMLLTFRPNGKAPPDPETGLPVTHVESRISALIAQLEKQNVKIILPTPALSELLVDAGASAQSLIFHIRKSPTFFIEPFDIRAAIEVALMTRKAKDAGDKRSGVDAPWAKVKYDRQIIAIAKVNRATAIYSDDEHIHTHGKAAKIEIIRLADLPIPIEELVVQKKLNFSEIKEIPFETEGSLNQEILEYEEEQKTE